MSNLRHDDGSVRMGGEVGHAYRTENIVKVEREFTVCEIQLTRNNVEYYNGSSPIQKCVFFRDDCDEEGRWIEGRLSSLDRHVCNAVRMLNEDDDILPVD